MTIVWLRQDLRLHDNPALWTAVQEGLCIPIYIYDEETLPFGGASKWWLHHSLLSMQQNLRKRGYPFYILRGKPLAILEEIISTIGAKNVVWNRCYEPAVIDRDTHIKSTLESRGIRVNSFNGSLLFEPWEIQNKQGNFFKVFTPFWKHCLQQPVSESLPEIPNAAPSHPKSFDIKDLSLESLNLLPTQPDWSGGIQSAWTPGEGSALKLLDTFIHSKIENYKSHRDFLDKDATSKLSPHLHFGEISPKYIWHQVQSYLTVSQDNLTGAQHFLSELGWREFSYHLLFHAQHLPFQAFRPEFESFPWQTDERDLKAWQHGKTGIPVVDAGMRELWHTGYMHNRVRMIVASFLTKNLLISWQKGSEWFWDTLVDADLANNSASWQWVAGSAADAAPYFRIFNPVTQGEKFDPEGNYVRKWVPELSRLETKYIHQPWTADNCTLVSAGIELGKTYPSPIVDLKATRQRALDAYAKIRN